MSSEIVQREKLDLKQDPNLLSPPSIVAPLYSCATAVTVTDYVLRADIELQINGLTIITAQGGFPLPHGITIQINGELSEGDAVKARQFSSNTESEWSDEVIVQNHIAEYPAGPPRPAIDPAPVYECGVRTGVSNLLTGGHTWITSNGTTVGSVKGSSKHQGVNVFPAYDLAKSVRAWFKICDDVAPPSIEYITQPPTNPLPQLTIDSNYEGGQSVTVSNVVNGAKVTLYRDGIPEGTWGCWGYKLTINNLSSFTEGEVFSATQSMCLGAPSSEPEEATVQPCSSLPAPTVDSVQAGDNRIILTSFIPDAIITVYRNGVQVGISGGSVIILSETLVKGDVVYITQDLLDCTSQFALKIIVDCVAPPLKENPSSLNLFPVGWMEYNNGDERGIVYYPAEDDGETQVFYKRLSSLGKVPIVFIAHGNHSPEDPSYRGYRYFQEKLARIGVIAVSIDCNEFNGFGGGVANIENRADLIISNIAYFQKLDNTLNSVFFEKIDFSHTGLMGHSRGGDAVVMIPDVINLSDVVIKSVLSLAPTNFRFWSGFSTIKPDDYAFMTVLPAGDGDVRDNNGAQFYDLAIPAPYKSQVYIHYTNHNYFNREWLFDDSTNFQQPPVMARSDHENILSAYGCAFFRNTLLNHNTSGYILGYTRPANILNQHVYLSFQQAEALTIDNHEGSNGINKNSLGQPTDQLDGMNADEFLFEQAQNANVFNSSFYGESIGMVADSSPSGAIFRTELKNTVNLSELEIWIRAAVVTDGFSVPSNHSTGFELGVEDWKGRYAWIDSDEVGGLPSPYNRNAGMIKTMLNTLRFKGNCYDGGDEFDINNIQAILIRCNRRDKDSFAFDDLQIIKRIT